MYWGHEEDSLLSRPLRQIGTPCIVKCAIPYSDIESWCRHLAERFLSQSVVDVIDHPEPPPAFDLFADHDLLPINVLDIFEYADPTFQALTDCGNWDTNYQLLASG